METETPKLEPIGLESPTVTTPPTSSSPPSSPNAIRNASATTNGTSNEVEEEIQLEPTEEELERERLVAKAEQLQDEIENLRGQIRAKEEELYQVKQTLGITPFTEFKEGVYHGWKVMGNKWKEIQESETFRKIDSKIVGWKTKIEDSENYQKTKSSLNEGGKKASNAISSAAASIRDNEKVKAIGTKTSGAFQSAGTAIKNTGTSIRDSERVQNLGERIRSTSVRIKDRITGTSTADVDDGDNEPVAKETVVPDEPTKKE